MCNRCNQVLYSAVESRIRAGGLVAQKHKRGIWLCAQLGKFHQDCVTIHICVSFLICISFSILVCIYICAFICISFCICICICICMYICNCIKSTKWESRFVPNWASFTRPRIVSPFIFVPLFLSAFWTAFVSLYFYQMMMLAQLTFDCNKTALGEHHLPSKRPQPPPSACILHTLAVGSGANLFQMSMFMLYFINPRLCCSN